MHGETVQFTSAQKVTYPKAAIYDYSELVDK